MHDVHQILEERHNEMVVFMLSTPHYIRIGGVPSVKYVILVGIDRSSADPMLTFGPKYAHVKHDMRLSLVIGNRRSTKGLDRIAGTKESPGYT